MVESLPLVQEIAGSIPGGGSFYYNIVIFWINIFILRRISSSVYREIKHNAMPVFLDLSLKSIWIHINWTVFVIPLINHPQEPQGCQKIHKNILKIKMYRNSDFFLHQWVNKTLPKKIQQSEVQFGTFWTQIEETRHIINYKMNNLYFNRVLQAIHKPCIFVAGQIKLFWAVLKLHSKSYFWGLGFHLFSVHGPWQSQGKQIGLRGDKNNCKLINS